MTHVGAAAHAACLSLLEAWAWRPGGPHSLKRFLSQRVLGPFTEILEKEPQVARTSINAHNDALVGPWPGVSCAGPGPCLRMLAARLACQLGTGAWPHACEHTTCLPSVQPPGVCPLTGAAGIQVAWGASAASLTPAAAQGHLRAHDAQGPQEHQRKLVLLRELGEKVTDVSRLLEASGKVAGPETAEAQQESVEEDRQ